MPALAHDVFGSGIEQAARYAQLLAGPAVERGLLGPREGSVVWTRHILNCAAVVPLLGEAREVVDLGSGAGLPGIVVALARPDLAVTLLEPLARRFAFLQEAVADLGLATVDVVRTRAEDWTGSTDVVVARAVAPLHRLVGWATPMLRPGGSLLALKGETAGREVTEAQATLRRHDARADICPVTTPGAMVATTVVRVIVNPH